MKTGVLLMAYGTPASPGDLEPYYTHIRRGRPPSPEQLDDLRRRYEAIGGASPLAGRTRAQAEGVQQQLDRREPGRFRVALGMKHAAPFIEDAMETLARRGVDELVTLVLAPHFSRLSVGEYQERAAAAAERVGLAPPLHVDSWHLEPRYIDLLAGRVVEALATLPTGAKVLFTAHSLPSRILAEGDPYPGQLRQTVEAVAARVGLAPWTGWAVAWQSAGRTPEPWLGPDVLEVIEELAAAGGAPGVLVCPAGFVSDHLEVLYDLDVEARALAERLGLPFARTASLNDEPSLLATLADLVTSRAGTGVGA